MQSNLTDGAARPESGSATTGSPLLAILQQEAETAKRTERRLRYGLALQKDAIAALESALKFYAACGGAGGEPAAGALKILETCRQKARAI